MTRYLVTGAQGFTGRYVCAELLRAEPESIVVGTGRSPELATSFTHYVSGVDQRVLAPLVVSLQGFDPTRYTYVTCALGDAPSLNELVHQSAPDVVVHLAAALRDDAPDVLIESNVIGTINVVRAIAEGGRRPLLILGSSGSVYGIPQTLPMDETHPCSPNEPYAKTKLAAELVASVLTTSAHIPLIIARIFNIAGPGQDERHVCGRFAAQAAAIARGAVLPVLESGDLRPTRDFIDVRDVARALRILVHAGRAGEIYNVASGRETTIGEVLSETLRARSLLGSVSVAERYVRQADVLRAYADIGKLSGCGFSPAFTLERTIADLATYYSKDVTAAVGY